MKTRKNQSRQLAKTFHFKTGRRGRDSKYESEKARRRDAASRNYLQNCLNAAFQAEDSCGVWRSRRERGRSAATRAMERVVSSCEIARRHLFRNQDRSRAVFAGAPEG